jgi:hypothetical protein
MMDALKATASLLSGILPLIEKKIELIKLNPGVRDQVLAMSVVLAALGGFGAYRSLRNSRKGVTAGAIGMAVGFASFMLMIGLIGGLTFGMGPVWVSWSVKAAYVVMFTSLGVALGSFLSL